MFSRATILSFHPVEGSSHSWDLHTTGQLVDALQPKKRKPVFIERKWNHVVVFSRATILLFHPVEGSYRFWDLYTTGQLVDDLQQKKKSGFVFITGLSFCYHVTNICYYPACYKFLLWYNCFLCLLKEIQFLFSDFSFLCRIKIILWANYFVCLRLNYSHRYLLNNNNKKPH